MKRFILSHLICPACLPKEIPLEVSVIREVDDDIISGNLSCCKCKRHFPIRDGIAILLPESDTGPAGGQWRYEEMSFVDRYIWSHYSDLVANNNNGEANAAWIHHLANGTSSSLDVGCSVGRLTFEMAIRNRWAVGCDISFNFIRTARRLARERFYTFTLPLEGNLLETFESRLPDTYRTDNLEFIVADALKLPFARETFQQTVSLNVLDRVNYPLAHLYEMNRVAHTKDATFLFASPFSWTTSSSPEELWLGGTLTGAYKGRGIDNVRSLLEGKDAIISPVWQISSAGTIEWKMRTHANHYEVIRSSFLNAERI